MALWVILSQSSVAQSAASHIVAHISSGVRKVVVYDRALYGNSQACGFSSNLAVNSRTYTAIPGETCTACRRATTCPTVVKSRGRREVTRKSSQDPSRNVLRVHIKLSRPSIPIHFFSWRCFVGGTKAALPLTLRRDQGKSSWHTEGKKLPTRLGVTHKYRLESTLGQSHYRLPEPFGLVVRATETGTTHEYPKRR